MFIAAAAAAVHCGTTHLHTVQLKDERISDDGKEKKFGQDFITLPNNVNAITESFLLFLAAVFSLFLFWRRGKGQSERERENSVSCPLCPPIKDDLPTLLY